MLTWVDDSLAVSCLAVSLNSVAFPSLSFFVYIFPSNQPIHGCIFSLASVVIASWGELTHLLMRVGFKHAWGSQVIFHVASPMTWYFSMNSGFRAQRIMLNSPQSSPRVPPVWYSYSKLMHKWLPLTGRIARWKNVNPCFHMCGVAYEEISHLFWACPLRKGCGVEWWVP